MFRHSQADPQEWVPLLLRNYRKYQHRRMLGIVKNRVRGGNKPVPLSDFFAGIEVAIESREFAAGDF